MPSAVSLVRVGWVLGSAQPVRLHNWIRETQNAWGREGGYL